ncbi:MAG: DNA recombination protein RmuC [Kiritimatiellia bacterium]
MSGMDTFWLLTGLGIGVAGGSLALWLIGRASVARQRAEAECNLATLRERSAMQESQATELRAARAAGEQRLTELQRDLQRLAAREAELSATLLSEREATTQKLALLENARTALADAFQALSAEALRHNNQSFLDLARAALEKFQEQARGDLSRRQQAIDELVKPVRESLEKFDRRVGEIELSRTDAYARLTEQVLSLQGAQELLRKETGNLAKALGSPQSRGRWGELTLRRVVEMAGMQRYCDFDEQVNLPGEEGRLRPDLIVRIPGGRCVAVDAKVPLNAYLEAMNATDDAVRRAKMADHARRVREHIRALSAKSYSERLNPVPEFVVLFLPGESFYGAALEADPTLIEAGVECRVVLATPTTLIALLKAVSFGWRQEALAENAQHISELGRELYKRLADMTGHFEDLGERLRKATESYNKAMGSLESRVLVSARRFEELQAAATDQSIPVLEPIETLPRKPIET